MYRENMYLTDVIAPAVNDGNQILTTQAENSYEVEGVNDRKQLAKLERIFQQGIANQSVSLILTVYSKVRLTLELA